MNKAELLERMVKLSKEQKATCKRCLDSFINIIGEELKKGREVALTGFGTFKILKRKARMGMNPATGKKMSIPAKKVPKFQPGKGLKQLIK